MGNITISKRYFYQCDVNSIAGRRVMRFWRKAQRAAERAEDYAKKYGAKSYICPVQYFEGGVEYLEFEKEPDTRVWRKKMEVDGRAQYEPRCEMKEEILVIPDNRFQPSDTWNRVYSKKHISWEEAKPRFPLSYWAKVIHYALVGDRETDNRVVDEAMSRYSFVPYVEFLAEQDEQTRTIPQTLRRAICAEKQRQALPVVYTEELYALLGMVQPSSREEARQYNDSPTPTFFQLDDTLFLSVPLPCSCQGLHEVSEKRYTVKQNELETQRKLKALGRDNPI